MSTVESARERIIATADATCPRCGAARAADQAYCLECGFNLPIVTGRLPELRRRWIRRFGWYPGDWFWPALLALAVAVVGATAAILLTAHRHTGPRRVITALANVPVAEPAAPAATARAGTTKLPTAPEPRTSNGGTTKSNGRFVWPSGENGWTIVLVSYPKTTGRPAALQTASQAAKAGLGDVGVLDSSKYPSLQPGYYVVFSGVYTSQVDANAAVSTVHQAGFGGAYSRQIG